MLGEEGCWGKTLGRAGRNDKSTGLALGRLGFRAHLPLGASINCKIGERGTCLPAPATCSKDSERMPGAVGGRLESWGWGSWLVGEALLGLTARRALSWSGKWAFALLSSPDQHLVNTAPGPEASPQGSY